MRLRDHYKDRVTKILGALVVLAILSGFLYIVGNTFATIFLMDGTVIGIWMIEDLIGWHRRKSHLVSLSSMGSSAPLFFPGCFLSIIW